MKTNKLKIVVGSEAGGGFSSYSLLLSAYLGKNIPGNPAVSIQHLPGSGGVNAIDYLANAAPKDGTVIAVAMPNFFVTPFVEPSAVIGVAGYGIVAFEDRRAG